MADRSTQLVHGQKSCGHRNFLVLVIGMTSWCVLADRSGVGRIFVWGPHRGAEGAEGRDTEGAEGVLII